ncbi:MAG: hypothetical protein DI552_00100 [Brevundimonas sp.]|uniref:DUF4376 domain-containing protein n=1 Tax=Brevundimonas sp. TaxID=1871086 RepID=UPI000DBBDF35|nr:hypothetical protein [Brevundimonas sp.]PZU62306.1 MAG: hypothetical protein DI552_00100 [Brevundimonas sp.]
MTLALNGEPILTPEVTIGDYVYSRDSLAIMAPAEREALGVTVLPDPEPTLEDLRAAANAAVTARREAVFEAGFPVPSGPLAGQHLQLRNADDKANWMIAEKNARAAVGVGLGETPLVKLRTLENNTVTVTPNQALTVLAALEAWSVAVLGRAWALKDQNDAATDAAGLTDEADLESGWPG